MIIIFIGPPFAGKGTQTEILSKKLSLQVFSMGKLIREANKEGNPKAVEGFEKYSMKGLHLPVSLKFDLLKEKMDNAENGFILDNFPATKEDLDIFIEYLGKNHLSVNKVFYINISEEEANKRITRRGRADDDINILMKRREAQDQDRQPVIEYFRSKGLLEEINGEKDVEDVHKEVVNKLSKNDSI